MIGLSKPPQEAYQQYWGHTLFTMVASHDTFPEFRLPILGYSFFSSPSFVLLFSVSSFLPSFPSSLSFFSSLFFFFLFQIYEGASAPSAPSLYPRLQTWVNLDLDNALNISWLKQREWVPLLVGSKIICQGKGSSEVKLDRKYEIWYPV